MTFNEGDQVYIYSSGYLSLSRGVITRVTKTQAIIDHGRYEQRFNRETGRMVSGDSWTRTRIGHPTPVLDAAWRRAQIDAARLRLRVAAEKRDNDGAIREAFAEWDALSNEGTTTS